MTFDDIASIHFFTFEVIGHLDEDNVEAARRTLDDLQRFLMPRTLKALNELTVEIGQEKLIAGPDGGS